MTATAVEFDAKTNVETWETTTGGTVWVWVRDPREAQGYRKQRVGGSTGSKILRITTDDRRFNQEQVVDEMLLSDPFTNGLLRKTDEKHVDDVIATYHLTNDDLMQLLELKDADAFEGEITDIHSELVLRRLAALADKHATVGQRDFIQELLEKKYGKGGTQQSIREQDRPGYRGLSLSGN